MLLSRNFPALFKIDNAELASPANVRGLFALLTANAGAERYSTLRRLRAAAGYLVTTDTTLYLTRVRVRSTVAGAVLAFSLGTSDVGIDSAAGPAAEVRIDWTAASDGGVLIVPTANVVTDFDVFFDVTSARYLAVRTALGTAVINVQAWGVEV